MFTIWISISWFAFYVIYSKVDLQSLYLDAQLYFSFNICSLLQSSFAYKYWKNSRMEKEGYVSIAQGELQDP